jgi:hypothetical protein
LYEYLFIPRFSRLLSLNGVGVFALSAEASSAIVSCLAAHLGASGKYVFALYVAAALGGPSGRLALNASFSFAIFAQLLVF